MNNFSQRKKMYIAIEGIDGCGKDTQADMLTRRLQAIRVSEPDSYSPTGALLRTLLRNGKHPEAIAPLFLADRLILQTDKVAPALQQNRHVVSVRSWLSTLVYQQDHIDPEWIISAHSILPCQISHLILLDLPVEESLKRLEARNLPLEVYERREGLLRYRERYLSSVHRLNARTLVLDATENEDQIHERIWDFLKGDLLVY